MPGFRHNPTLAREIAESNPELFKPTSLPKRILDRELRKDEHLFVNRIVQAEEAGCKRAVKDLEDVLEGLGHVRESVAKSIKGER